MKSFLPLALASIIYLPIASFPALNEKYSANESQIRACVDGCNAFLEQSSSDFRACTAKCQEPAKPVSL